VDLEGHRRQGPREAATGEAMSEKIGPFIVPTADGKVALIHDYERIELPHHLAVHWWWTLSQYLNRWAEEQRKANAKL
jgi:hypothetical protein